MFVCIYACKAFVIDRDIQMTGCVHEPSSCTKKSVTNCHKIWHTYKQHTYKQHWCTILLSWYLDDHLCSWALQLHWFEHTLQRNVYECCVYVFSFFVVVRERWPLCLWVLVVPRIWTQSTKERVCILCVCMQYIVAVRDILMTHCVREPWICTNLNAICKVICS